MNIVYTGKFAGIAIGATRLPRHKVVEVSDEVAEQLIEIADVDLTDEEPLKEESADEEDPATLEDTETDKDDE